MGKEKRDGFIGKDFCLEIKRVQLPAARCLHTDQKKNNKVAA